MGIKVVIFDLDGVVFESDQVWLKITKKLLCHFGIPFTQEILYEIANREFEESFVFLSEHFSLSFVEIRDYFFSFAPQMFFEEVKLKSGVKEWIQKLQERNIPCCVATASLPIFYQRVFKKYDLNFSKVVYTQELGVSKRSAEVYLACLNGIKPSEALVIEDSEIGYKSATMQGFRAILVGKTIDWREIDEECFKYSRK